MLSLELIPFLTSKPPVTDELPQRHLGSALPKHDEQEKEHRIAYIS